MRLNSSAAALATAGILLAATGVAAQSAAETRLTVFDGVVQTVSEQFYDPTFHGVDWAAVHTRYRARLDQVANEAELRRLIEQMLGELKSSHLYLTRTIPGIRHVGVGARIEPVDGADTILELALSRASRGTHRPGHRQRRRRLCVGNEDVEQGAPGGGTDGPRHFERREFRHRSRLEPHGADRRPLEHVGGESQVADYGSVLCVAAAGGNDASTVAGCGNATGTVGGSATGCSSCPRSSA